MKTFTPLETLFEARLHDRQARLEAAQRIDAFRRRYGKPTKGFDTLTILRKLRRTR